MFWRLLLYIIRHTFFKKVTCTIIKNLKHPITENTQQTHCQLLKYKMLKFIKLCKGAIIIEENYKAL